MSEPTHDEALSALDQIRRASDLADLAENLAFKARLQAKATKLVAENAGFIARSVARAMTHPLPLFDEKDGMSLPQVAPSDPTKKKASKTPQIDASKSDPEPARPLPLDDVPVSDLTMPDEVRYALEAFGMTRMGTVRLFWKAGCDWSIIPGIDAAGAERLDSALARFFAGEPQDQQGSEGRAA